VLARALGFVLVLAGYWSPWVAHPAVGLAISEIDFNEFPKFMPQVRSGELDVWRESFYLSLLGPAVGLVVWAARGRGTGVEALSAAVRTNWRRTAAHAVRSFNWRRWLMRAVALGIPITPSIFNVFEQGEFLTQLRLVVAVAVVIVLTPLIRRMPAGLIGVLLAIWFVYSCLMPVREFLKLLPALEAIYHEPIVIGWGFWAGLAGFAVLALAELWAVLAHSVAGHRTHLVTR
jgi:hypothetical protein